MIRLGRISYVNMAPVFYGLEADVEEVAGVPTELNRMLLPGGDEPADTVRKDLGAAARK